MSQLPDCILKDPGAKTAATKRRQGKRGGVRQRFREQRLSRIPLPSMILGNVQSLRNKMDELQGNVSFLKDFREYCVLAFTETWLTENDQDNDLSIDGFGAPYRLDRERERGNREISRWRGMFIFQQTILHFCDCKRTYLYIRC